VTYNPDSNGGEYASSSATLVETITGAASTLTVVSGSGQTTTYGSEFANPLVVVVKDANGNPVSGVVVTFSGSGLSFSSSTAITGSNGEASVAVTANASGSLTATASIGGAVSPVTFSLTANPAILASPRQMPLFHTGSRFQP